MQHTVKDMYSSYMNSYIPVQVYGFKCTTNNSYLSEQQLHVQLTMKKPSVSFIHDKFDHKLNHTLLILNYIQKHIN